MLHHNSLSEKCEERFSTMFATLKLGTLLRQADIRKSFGLPALAVFQLIFTLVSSSVAGLDYWKATTVHHCREKMLSIVS